MLRIDGMRSRGDAVALNGVRGRGRVREHLVKVIEKRLGQVPVAVAVDSR